VTGRFNALKLNEEIDMANMLLDKCYLVDVMGYWDDPNMRTSGWKIEQTLEASGLDIIGLIASNDSSECRLEFRRKDTGKRVGYNSMLYMLDMAQEYITKSRKRYILEG
jgi:hypothetical protein